MRNRRSDRLDYYCRECKSLNEGATCRFCGGECEDMSAGNINQVAQYRPPRGSWQPEESDEHAFAPGTEDVLRPGDCRQCGARNVLTRRGVCRKCLGEE